MSGLLERVRAALADEYDVERELAGGGMGVVFLGRDRSLDCPVAIKVLRIDLATAVAAERFVQEAQMLARVRHPAIVTVHRAFSRDGLHFMIMELLGGTLADRLSTGQSMSADECIRFGEQLLDGLAQVHAAGIVHRDIKPSNIFIREDGGPKLGDFGIARRLDTGDDNLTAPGQLVGTPRYMSPEQLVSSEVTGTSDVYSVGMVLYEMVSGRRWELEDPARGRWDGVPRRLQPVLRRALTLEQNLRWPDARAFEAALRDLRNRARQLRGIGVGAGVVAALGITIAAVIGLLRPQPVLQSTDRTDVALVPFAVRGEDADIGKQLVFATEAHLNGGFGDGGMPVTPAGLSVPWATEHASGDFLPPDSWDALKTNAIVHGHATVSGDSVVVTGEVVERDGTTRPLSSRVSGLLSDLGDVGCGVALAIVRTVEPDKVPSFACLRTGNVSRTNEWIAGEAAFWHDNWPAAEQAYRRAVALDSSSARAWWSLYNVCRWGRSCDARAPRARLEAVYARSAKRAGDLDRLLIEAEFAPTVRARLTIYDTAVRKFGYDAYPKLLLGNELFHRGALVGAGLDSAIATLNEAAAENPYLSPVYEMLAWAQTRRGREQEARSALAQYRERAAVEQERGLSFPTVLGLVINERFASQAEIQRGRQELSASPVGWQSVGTMLRLGLALGVPKAQLDFGEAVAAQAPDAESRAHGLIAQSLALLALGRVREALDRFEIAASIVGDPELELQALEWRVGLPALGLPGVPEEGRTTARARLAGITGGVQGARASWVRVLDALAAGDDPGAAAAAGRIRDTRASPFLSRLSDAFLSAARGDTITALSVTDSLRQRVDSHHEIDDPLVRVALFLSRGRWLAGRDPAAADAAWRWYENADWAGTWPSGPPNTAEMDWAFETYARYLRAASAHARGDTTVLCAVARDAIDRWQHADSAYAGLRRDIEVWATACGPS